MKRIALFAACLLALTFTASGTASAQSTPLVVFEKDKLSIETPQGPHEFQVEIAETPGQRAQGLMYRREMAADAGMLFLFGGQEERAMWMKNTFIPLDMLFIEKSGRIRRIEQRTVPHSLRAVVSGGPVFAVLELNAGTVSRLSIRPGDRVVYPAFK